MNLPLAVISTEVKIEQMNIKEGIIPGSLANMFWIVVAIWILKQEHSP